MKDKKPVYWLSHVEKHDDFGQNINDIIIDGKTKMGPWALMNPESHAKHGFGLGPGLGQKYQLQEDGKWLKNKFYEKHNNF